MNHARTFPVAEFDAFDVLLMLKYYKWELISLQDTSCQEDIFITSLVISIFDLCVVCCIQILSGFGLHVELRRKQDLEHFYFIIWKNSDLWNSLSFVSSTRLFSQKSEERRTKNERSATEEEHNSLFASSSSVNLGKKSIMNYTKKVNNLFFATIVQVLLGLYQTSAYCPVVICPGFGNDIIDYIAPLEQPEEVGFKSVLSRRGFDSDQIYIVPVKRSDWLKVGLGLFDIPGFYTGTAKPVSNQNSTIV